MWRPNVGLFSKPRITSYHKGVREMLLLLELLIFDILENWELLIKLQNRANSKINSLAIYIWNTALTFRTYFFFLMLCWPWPLTVKLQAVKATLFHHTMSHSSFNMDTIAMAWPKGYTTIPSAYKETMREFFYMNTEIYLFTKGYTTIWSAYK